MSVLPDWGRKREMFGIGSKGSSRRIGELEIVLGGTLIYGFVGDDEESLALQEGTTAQKADTDTSLLKRSKVTTAR